MPDEKILIVDDEREINNLIRSYIKKEGYKTIQAFTGEEAMSLVKSERPDLIVLDVMLPDIEGPNLSLEIRKISNAPILFCSCKDEEIDKIVALSAGGDDYMTKPFKPGEFIARVKAHLRRHQQSGTPVINSNDRHLFKFQGLSVNTDLHEVVVSGNIVKLTPKEFEMLCLFVKNPERIFSAEQLFEVVWKENILYSDAKTVMVYISTLRKKIEFDPNNPKYIISVRGFGYKFNHHIAETTEDSNGSPYPTPRRRSTDK
ncbi:MAG: response regulator transcription factor [Clostridiales Family XIII bacterium]|jgi:DNA-binding response OmpR family regulator|nr:response regulator transcription factor [Clostridiales Family XIII bacterium]